MAFVGPISGARVGFSSLTSRQQEAVCRRSSVKRRQLGLVRMTEGTDPAGNARKQKLIELEELARIEEKYGRKGLISDEDLVELRDEGIKDYNKKLLELVSDTVFIGLIGAISASYVYPLPTVASFGLGVVGSILYVFLLSRTVDRLASSARQGGRGGDLLGPARFLVLGVIVLFISKYQDKTGLEVIPATIGFLSYKVALFIPLLSGEETIDL